MVSTRLLTLLGVALGVMLPLLYYVEQNLESFLIFVRRIRPFSIPFLVISLPPTHFLFLSVVVPSAFLSLLSSFISFIHLSVSDFSPRRIGFKGPDSEGQPS